MALDSSKIHFAEEDNVDNIDILLSYHLVSAQVFKKLAQLDSSLYFLQKAYDISKAYNYSYGKAESELQMGAITIMKKNYVAAEKYLLSGIKEAESVNYYGMLNDGYKYLSDVYAVTGRYKEAYEYFQKHKQVNDSVVNMESKKYGKELEKK
ncbi:hypothetical protein ABXV24_26290, partial [Vibrio owensii]|uniref:hypothetical protein n=1 Tax=Vibrio owensii TaxID=696485 RepID=UPI0033923424